MADEEGGKTDPQAEPSDDAAEIDDTEGQALTWKVKKPIPEVDDDAEGHSGPTGSPRPPVD